MEQNEKLFYNTYVAKPSPTKDDNHTDTQKILERTNQDIAQIDTW